MMLTSTKKRNQTLKYIHEDLLSSVRRAAKQRQAQHEKHQHVMRELRRQRAFLSPTSRRKLMHEIRERSAQRRALRDYKTNVVLNELLHMTSIFGARPSLRVILMEEIRMVGQSRAIAKDDYSRAVKEIPLAVRRRNLTKELRKYISSRHLIRDMKLRMLLELHRQKAFKRPSIQKRMLGQIRSYGREKETKRKHELLMLEMRAFGRFRATVRKNHKLLMAELHQHFAKKWQSDKKTLLMEELLRDTATRQQVRNRKNELLLELRASQAFGRPSTRRELMHEIHKETSQRNVMKDFKEELIRDLKVFYAFNKLLPGHKSPFKHTSSSVSAAA